MATTKIAKRVLGKIDGLLACIDPEVDFDTFHEIMELIYVETHGHCKGLELLDAWYSQADEYPGLDTLADMWFGYMDDEQRYFGIGGLMHLAHEGFQTQTKKKTSQKATRTSTR